MEAYSLENYKYKRNWQKAKFKTLEIGILIHENIQAYIMTQTSVSYHPSFYYDESKALFSLLHCLTL